MLTTHGLATKLLTMNRKQAEALRIDLGKSLTLRDYTEDVYLNIKGVGSKTYKSAAYFESENWLFIWTLTESVVLNRKDVGDFVFVPNKDTVITARSIKTCY